jgi:type II secretory pathway pseudopilin PulG
MNMRLKQMKNTSRDEKGFASIVIALILIIVLSLLTVGFAQLARREQQNALDKQLATQAYYAAESGINDAYKDVQSGLITDQPPSPTPNINTDKCIGAPLTNGSHNDITPGSGVSSGVAYSCVLVNMQPPTQVFNGVSPNADQHETFSTNGSLSSLTVYWGSADNKTTSRPALGPLTPSGSWNSPAVLQLSITPLGAVDRGSLISNAFTVDLYPSNGGGAVNYDPANQGQIIGGHCTGSGTYPCSVTIGNLSGGPNESYLVHIINYYDVSNISLGNLRDTSNTQLDFQDGQIVIDSTGTARSTLKRLQVYLPLTETAPLPPYSLEGQNLCKRFSTEPTLTTPDTLPGCSLN